MTLINVSMKDEKELIFKLESIINSAIDGIITINNQGLIETFNEAAAQIFQYKQEEVIGQNIKVLMPQPHRKQHDGYLDNYQKTKVKKIIGIGREVFGLKKDGTKFPFRLAVSEVILNDRVIYSGIIHDLTEVFNINQKLEAANEDLENKVEERTKDLETTVNKLLATNEKLKRSQLDLEIALNKEKELSDLKTRFVSMASHEFRTPLSTIVSSASLISRYVEEGQNEKRQKHVDRIKSSVVNLTGILNDFLSLSKLEEGKIEVNKETFNLSEYCAEIIDELKGLLKDGQEIQHNYNNVLSIYTDKRILKNILFNLISNGIKYSKENGVIECEVLDKNGQIEFVIKDNGLGIPENEQKHLFDRFFRASNVESIQGTGLGLNIVKRYIDLLNGEIKFTSEENVGSTFRVKIPIK